MQCAKGLGDFHLWDELWRFVLLRRARARNLYTRSLTHCHGICRLRFPKTIPIPVDPSELCSSPTIALNVHFGHIIVTEAREPQEPIIPVRDSTCSGTIIVATNSQVHYSAKCRPCQPPLHSPTQLPHRLQEIRLFDPLPPRSPHRHCQFVPRSLRLLRISGW